MFVCGVLGAEITEPLPPEVATQSYEHAFFKMFVTLGILVILLCISFWLFRRLAKGRLSQMNHGKTIKILERRALSTKSILYVVEFSGKKLLIAESQLDIRKIDEQLMSEP